MAETYKMKIAGLERELIRCPLNEKLDIAAFIMFSDVELTIACAEELLKKCGDFDVILTAESRAYRLPTRCHASAESPTLWQESP